MDEKLINWLKLKKKFFKIRSVEEDLGMAQGSLNKYLLHGETLAEHWKPKIIEWIKKFRKL